MRTPRFTPHPRLAAAAAQRRGARTRTSSLHDSRANCSHGSGGAACGWVKLQVDSVLRVWRANAAQLRARRTRQGRDSQGEARPKAANERRVPALSSKAVRGRLNRGKGGGGGEQSVL